MSRLRLFCSCVSCFTTAPGSWTDIQSETWSAVFTAATPGEETPMAAIMMAYPVRDSFHGYPQQYDVYQQRAHQPQVDVAHSLNVNPYATFVNGSEAQQYLQPQSRSAQLSHSPVAEDGFRPSLPPISNLLGIADGDRPSNDAGMLAFPCYLRNAE